MRGALQLPCSARGPCPVWGQRPLKQADGTSPLPSSCLTLDSIAHSLHTQLLPLWVTNMASEGNNSLGVKTSNHLHLSTNCVPSCRWEPLIRCVLFGSFQNWCRFAGYWAENPLWHCWISFRVWFETFVSMESEYLTRTKILSLKNTCHFSRNAQLNQFILIVENNCFLTENLNLQHSGDKCFPFAIIIDNWWQASF